MRDDQYQRLARQLSRSKRIHDLFVLALALSFITAVSMWVYRMLR